MILYQLKCSGEHEFEAWFRDSATYEQQAADSGIACPFCGDTSVCKAPMAPNISTGGTPAVENKAEDRARLVAEQILKAVDRLRNHMADECDYVGDRFADEARRIHYAETEERGIYGEAGEDEACELEEEGIEFYRLPAGVRKND